MEISGNAFSSGLSGIQAGQRRVEQAASEIAGNTLPTQAPAEAPPAQQVEPSPQSQANTQADMADTVGQKLVDALRQPYVLDGHRLVITVSIGFSLCPVHAAEGSRLLLLADSAMYEGKRQGKNRCLRASDDHTAMAPSKAQRTAALGRR